MPDPVIGDRYGISFGTLQRIVTEAYGANVTVLKRPKQVKRWHPVDFREETTTVWSFRQRGNWATHNGRYRGNWSPYIPRNIILKYSRPGDTVLDYFVGGGTTAVEAKLLGRRCIARDINPGAIGITLENLRFTLPAQLLEEACPLYEPKVSVGDARDLSDIPDGVIDLICAHPPYAGIIKYGAKITGDLSDLSLEQFLEEMSKVAKESLRVLKPGGKCAILIGDARKSRCVVPIGFQVIRVFLNAGFLLHELVIKRQHNCKTTGFWYARSIEHNFLLLAHEYLPVFEKPRAQLVGEATAMWQYVPTCRTRSEKVSHIERENLETTTVWIFPAGQLDFEVRRNLLGRFGSSGAKVVDLYFDGQGKESLDLEGGSNLVFVHCPEELTDQSFEAYRVGVRKLLDESARRVAPGTFVVLEAKDFRAGGVLVPAGLYLWEEIAKDARFKLKEIVVVVPEKVPDHKQEFLSIVHRYLLVLFRI